MVVKSLKPLLILFFLNCIVFLYLYRSLVSVPFSVFIPIPLYRYHFSVFVPIYRIGIVFLYWYIR